MKKLTEPVNLLIMIITLFTILISGLWSVFNVVENVATKEETTFIKLQLAQIQADVTKTKNIAEFNKLEIWINLADDYILEIESIPVNDWTPEQKRKYKEYVENVMLWKAEREQLIND